MARGGKHREVKGPHRSCIGCRAVRPQSDLVRVVLQEGQPVVDARRAFPGRGAYLCPSESCAAKAVRQFSRAFRQQAANVASAAFWQQIEAAVLKASSIDPLQTKV